MAANDTLSTSTTYLHEGRPCHLVTEADTDPTGDVWIMYDGTDEDAFVLRNELTDAEA